MSSQIPKLKLNDGDGDDHDNASKIRVDNDLSNIYIDLHRSTTRRVNFKTQKLSKELSAIVLPIDYVRASHGFFDELPDEVKRALELQRQFDKDPDIYERSWPDEKLRRAMLRWHKVADYSIMMLSMLAFSGHFRNMVKQGSESMWSLIWLKILENHESIEYFAKARGLQWIDLLERNQNFKVVIDAALTLGEEKFPEDEVPIENPHTRVVPASGGKLRLPTSRLDPLTPQTMIDENIYDKEQWGGGNFRRPKTWPEVWPYPFNPMTRIPLEGYDENCACCGSEKICSCQLTDAKRYKDTLLELRDYGGRGVGVRTLQFIEAGTILGEYLGEIVPCGDAYDEPWNLDTVYGWEIQIDIPNGPRPNPLGTIAGKRVGNWCRYVNHSCDSSLSGTPAIVGAKRCLLYWANRDILPFEELTVDYGETYFDPVNNPCRCGEDNCYYSALEKDEKSDADEGEGDKEDVALKDVDEEELGEDDLETDIEGEDESHYYDYGDVV